MYSLQPNPEANRKQRQAVLLYAAVLFSSWTLSADRNTPSAALRQETQTVLQPEPRRPAAALNTSLSALERCGGKSPGWSHRYGPDQEAPTISSMVDMALL